jgi:rod shape determining protein RodA
MTLFGIYTIQLDRPLFYALLFLAALSLLILYSATGQSHDVVIRHALRLTAGFVLMLVIAQMRPETLARWTPYLFVLGLLLLLVVLAAGSVSKGAQRWLNLGVVRIQPSELMKIAVPMMLGWFFARADIPPRLWQLAIAALIILIPALLVARQPDLGTAVLIFGAGGLILFLAGMGWRTMGVVTGLLLAALPLVWTYMHDYQRKRIFTLLDPTSDPLGTGYHTIQSMIAIGSGGFFGKGWLNSTQAHLEYLPESSTDFVFAVFAEEFGLLGIIILLAVYLYIVGRGLMIAFFAQDTYTRLVAGGLTLSFFLYFFINVGMVSGILPVVGVPLPLISYGGTSVVTLMAAFGMLMSIHTHRKLVTT